MQVISSLPGRVRFKNPYLYYDKDLAEYINFYLETLVGVNNSKVNHNSATILIEYDKDKIGLEELKQKINYIVDLAVNKNKREDLSLYENYINLIKKKEKAKRRTLIYTLIYLLLRTKESTVGKFSISRNVRVLQAASIVTIVGGYPLLKSFYKRFMKNVPTDADILLKLTAVSFTLLRESNKGIFVLLMKSLSDYIKYSAMIQCQKTLRNIKGNFINMVLRLNGENEELVPVNMLSKGDIIKVNRGEAILVNGKVVKGSALVSSLYYTGQISSEKIEVNDLVSEGMYIVSGQLILEVSEVPQYLNKPEKPLEKLEMHSRIKRYQRRITPVALTTAVASYIYTGSAMNALSTLLVMTPSAAMTALNSGISSYINLLKRRQIYVRNVSCIENASKVDAVIFDKTGTLTNGQMNLVDVDVIDKRYSKNELLRICAACEYDGMHPISITLKEYGEKESLQNLESSFYIPSKGVFAEYNGLKVLIGNDEIMRDYNIDVSLYLDRYEMLKNNFFTPVFVAIDNKLSAIIVLKDVLRHDSYRTIQNFKSYGINNITLLTGDKHENAVHIGEQLGINRIFSECSLQEKSDIVRKMARRNTVLMTGDGINDVMAMREADVSVSLTNTSCDRVFMHSDCIVLDDDLTKVADFVSLSKKSYNAINNTITFSRLYNLILGGFAFFGYFDAFTAKSLNTLNSLYVLLLNKRIEYFIPDKLYVQKDSSQNYPLNKQYKFVN